MAALLADVKTENILMSSVAPDHKADSPHAHSDYQEAPHHVAKLADFGLHVVGGDASRGMPTHACGIP